MAADRTPLGELVIADDDSAFLDILVRTFRPDFVVHAAENGTRALSILETVKPVAILADEMMPGLTGTELLAQAKKLAPDAARLLITASTDFQRAVQAINQGEIHRFFSKPLRPTELRYAVVGLVERMQAEALLRVELQTLRDLKTPEVAKPRVLLVGRHVGGLDLAAEACRVRGYPVEKEESPTMAQTRVANRAPDLLLVVWDETDTALEMLEFGQSVDAEMPVVVVDPVSTLARATAALAGGATDYVDFGTVRPAELAQRLERAVHHRLVQRDVHRMTRDLILANRSLAAQRRRSEAEQVRVLNAMIRALEARDTYTAGHTDRVAEISVRLGQVMELKPDELEHVRIGALLHDIGKIAIRDAILLKPAELSKEEFKVIQTHAPRGFELLQEVEQFKCVLPAIRFHHERMDGSGYPDRLTGQDIPLQARIVAVADIVDAVTSTRPYREATSVTSAMDVIRSLDGTKLDSAVCEALYHLHRTQRLQDLLQVPPAGR